MANFKELYNKLKEGHCFAKGHSYIQIGTCDRYGSPSYGKDYIYYKNYGASAFSVSFEDFKWIAQTTFGCNTANEFVDFFKDDK